jgi:hypothetical protein
MCLPLRNAQLVASAGSRAVEADDGSARGSAGDSIIPARKPATRVAVPLSAHLLTWRLRGLAALPTKPCNPPQAYEHPIEFPQLRHL